MRERPPQLSDTDVLAAVRAHWTAEVDAVEYLPVGFGAHHWRATIAATPRLFVTFDQLGTRHTAASIEAAYAAAGVLAASGLEFVVASVPSRSGSRTVPAAGGVLSCTPWVAGTVAGTGRITDPALAVATADALARLHATTPPTGMPVWRPLVDQQFPIALRSSLAEPWTSGPYGERVRQLLVEHLADVGRWTERYHALAEWGRQRRLVPTHGEPHTANQLLTPEGPVFVDWESIALAPAERDLRALVDSGYGRLVSPDLAMLEMFDLEWRLDEVSQYAEWFSEPHGDTADDRIAFAGLVEELERVDWTGPG